LGATEIQSAAVLLANPISVMALELSEPSVTIFAGRCSGQMAASFHLLLLLIGVLRYHVAILI